MVKVAIITGSAYNREYLEEENGILFLNRHKQDVKKFSPPHIIDYSANTNLLKSEGVTHIIAISSTGAVPYKVLEPGDLFVPKSFIQLDRQITSNDEAHHIVPLFDEEIRDALIVAADIDDEINQTGVLWCNPGPRLETPAEAAFLGKFAHAVGMTVGNECTAACEAGLKYAALCTIDNVSGQDVPHNRRALAKLAMCVALNAAKKLMEKQ